MAGRVPIFSTMLMGQRVPRGGGAARVTKKAAEGPGATAILMTGKKRNS